MNQHLFFSIFLIFLTFGCTPQDEATVEDPGPTNAEIVESMYDAFGEGDIESVVAKMSPEIAWYEAENFIYWEGHPYVGPDAVVQGVFAKIGADWEYWNLSETAFHGVGDSMVLVTGRYQAKHNATGKEINAQVAHVWTLADGLATKFQQYTDTKQVAEAVVSSGE